MFIKTLLILAISLSYCVSCQPEVCQDCIKCISYDENYELVNEVIKCSDENQYLENYKLGFISGVEEMGWDAICLDIGVKCD